MNLAELLEGRRVCVCAGSGGVGKTTTSAAIALGMAARGRRVCVITIDPARRLATALGLEELGNTPRRVDLARLAAAGLELAAGGELWAMMLDPKRTFDDLIDETAPNPDRAAAIKANTIYEQFSSAVSGSQEFTAVTKLHELAGSDRFDLLVLEAPQRVAGFLEGRAFQALLRPAGFGARIVSVGAAPMLSGLRRVTGGDLIGDIITLFGLLQPLANAFTRRAREVEALLASPKTAFLIIAAARRASVDEAIWFRRTLSSRGLPFAGTVLNRFHPDPLEEDELDRDALGRQLTERLDGDGDLAHRVLVTLEEARHLAADDAANLTRLRAGMGREPVLAVPQLDAEVHDLTALTRMCAYLFGSEAERRELIEAVIS